MTHHNLTVVIPHHNRFTLLNRLLHTIPPHVSVVVVDDHSDEFDEIDALCQCFENVLLIELPQTQGAGVARTIGLTYVKTPYVMFADSDDVFVHEGFDVIEKHLDETYDVLVFKPISVDLEGQLAKRHLTHQALFDALEANEMTPFTALFKFKEVWSKVYKTQVVKNFKFSPTLVSNDILFSAQVAIECHAKTKWIDESVYSISDHDQAISFDHSKINYIHRIEAMKEYLAYCQQHLDRDTFKELTKRDGTMILWPIVKFHDFKLAWKTYQLYTSYNISIHPLQLILKLFHLKK